MTCTCDFEKTKFIFNKINLTIYAWFLKIKNKNKFNKKFIFIFNLQKSIYIRIPNRVEIKIIAHYLSYPFDDEIPKNTNIICMKMKIQQF